MGVGKGCRWGDTLRMRELLQDAPSLLNYQNPENGMTLLMTAVACQTEPSSFLEEFILQSEFSTDDDKEQHRVFRFLLEYGADVNLASPKTGLTALILACGTEYAHIEYIEELLAFGADINFAQPYPNYQTALMSAIEGGRLDFVKYLVKHGVDVNYTDVNHQTPFTYSLSLARYDIGLFLVQNGADYNVPICRKKDILKGFLLDSKDSSLVYLTEYLRYEKFPLDDARHKQKMALVNYLASKGIDYAHAPIPKEIVEAAKKEYPKTWREYLKRY